MITTKGQRIFQICNAVFLTIIGLTMVLPILHVIAQSFSDAAAINSGSVGIWPSGFTWENYHMVLKDKTMWVSFRNSVVITLFGTLINLAATASLAYPLSRPEYLYRKPALVLVLLTMIFHAPLIPNYLLLKNLHMLNTLWVLMIPGAISAFNVILVKTFFSSLPGEIEEAAKVDGLGVYGIFTRITVPLSKPILATMVLFSMGGLWNNWFGPSLYLQSKDKWPVALYLRQLIDSLGGTAAEAGASSETDRQIAATIKSAAMVLTSLPIICIYPFVQKYFVQGMMIGSVKG